MRKECLVNLTDRGNTLQFKIREMPALKLESWLMRAVLLLAKSGNLAGFNESSFPDISQAITLLRKNFLGVLGNINYTEAKPLLDELLTSCTLVQGNAEIPCTENMLNDLVQDVKTVLLLRKEAIQLNLGFFKREEDGGSSSPVKVNIGKPRKKSEA